MVVPRFDLSDSGGLGLVLTRGVADAAVLAVFGTLAFQALVAPAGMAVLAAKDAGAFRQSLTRLSRLLAATALPLLIVWLVLIARSLAEVAAVGPTLGAAWTVLRATSFGHIVAAELATLTVLLATLARPRSWGRSSLACGAILTGLQACHGHAYGMGNPLLLVSLIAHLLAAGAWLGALPALALGLARLPPPARLQLAQRFSSLGITAVLILAVTALFQGWALIGRWHLLVTSAYGWAALLKALLFALLLMLAAFNKLHATPRLARATEGRSSLFYAVTLEIILGLAIILAAGLLASLPPPGMTM